jgi:hypothetical protein
VSGWYCYQEPEIPGKRAFWDGGVTRGLQALEVPWTKPKKKKATGLWSEEAEIIDAPDWFLNRLPSCPLDGVICPKYMGAKDWQDYEYQVFASPPLQGIFTRGYIDNLGIYIGPVVEQFFLARAQKIDGFKYLKYASVEFELEWLSWQIYSQDDVCYLAYHKLLPESELNCARALAQLALGVGRTWVLRDPDGQWRPVSHPGVLRFAPGLSIDE